MFAVSSKDYWENREKEALKAYQKQEEEYDKEIERIYRDMLDAIQKEIDAFYAKYAKKEGITLAEAKKRVSKLDIEAYERKAKRYVKEAAADRRANGGQTDFTGSYFSEQANEEMMLYNLTMKVNRLEMLKANIGLELIKGHNELENFMGEILQGRTMEELERQAGILGRTIKDNAKLAHTIPNASFHNATFSDRIWQYQDLMKADLSKTLQTALIQGKNPRAVASEVRKHLIGDKYGKGARGNIERLMRTELARVQTEAQKKSIEEAGFEMYMFICNEDGRTCDICQKAASKDSGHGKGIYLIKDMMPGTNAAPLHPNCRCSTAPHEDSKDYEAWLEHLDKGGTTEEWNILGKKEKEAYVSGKMVYTHRKKKTKQTSRITIEEIKQKLNDAGVKYAQIDKMSIEQAENLLRAVETLPENCRPIFIGNGKDVSTITDRPLGRKADQWYGVTYDYRTFPLRTMQLGYEKTDYDGGLLVGVNTNKFKTFKSIEISKQVAQEKYIQRTGRKWFFNTKGEATAFHEMGHCYADVIEIPKGFEKDAMKWAQESQCDMLTKTEEAWAEAWAAYHIGNEELPDYIKKYIEDAVKG